MKSLESIYKPNDICSFFLWIALTAYWSVQTLESRKLYNKVHDRGATIVNNHFTLE